MENRAPFAGETKSEWYVSIGEQSIGPMSASEVHERVLGGELTWVSYVWKEGMADWSRIADVPTFSAAMPKPPAAKPKATPPAPPRPAEKLQPREWFLYYNDSQYGPFTEDEVNGLVGVGKVTSESFVWKDGMSDWEKIGSLAHFKSSFRATPTGTSSASMGASSPAPAEAATPAHDEKRQSLRKPVLAKVLIAEGSKIIVGMGRDISIGGMQVLSDFVPTKVGARLKLNISPPEPTNPSFMPFVAEGLVVRLHDDKRGFSFRFDELSAGARKIIERLLQG